MKLHVGDTVLVTGGKDKGTKGEITKVYPVTDRVLVKGANIYTRHIKKSGTQEGRRVKLERPLPVAKVAILNNEGKADRVAYVTRDGHKFRIFKKTGQTVPEGKDATAKKADKKAKQK